MPTCPLCRFDNAADAVVCEHCTRYRFPPAAENLADPPTLPITAVKEVVHRFGEPGGDNPSTQRASDSAPLSAAPLLPPRLVVLRGRTPGVEFPLIDGPNHLGRSGDTPADIDLGTLEPPDQVWSSRRHAVVHKDATLLSIEDCNSLNGTFLNRHKLQPGKRYHLRPGDVIQIGTVQLRVAV
jgi:FHA domain